MKGVTYVTLKLLPADYPEKLSEKDLDLLASIRLSWFEGTSSECLIRHVQDSISRKLNAPISRFHTLIREEKDNDDSNEFCEVVLSPCISSGSTLLVKYETVPSSPSQILPSDEKKTKPNAVKVIGMNKEMFVEIYCYFLYSVFVVFIYFFVVDQLDELTSSRTDYDVSHITSDISSVSCEESSSLIEGRLRSVLLWLTERNNVVKQYISFGFPDQDKLYTTFVECLLTSMCWGFSFLFIRKGMNPESRHNLFVKFWKDALFGSLAIFHSGFSKAVLKNLMKR